MCLVPGAAQALRGYLVHSVCTFTSALPNPKARKPEKPFTLRCPVGPVDTAVAVEAAL